MPPAATTSPNPLVLICGDDDYNVRIRAKAIYAQWCQELGGMDHEQIDATSSNGDEALKSLRKLREAINTLPFFGGGKAVWFKDCTFLGDDRVSGSAAVSESVSSLAEELKKFKWQNVRLLISAGKVDKRKAFYKAIDNTGTVEVFAALSLDDKEWADKAESHVIRELKARQKDITDEAVSELVQNIGPNLTQLTSEAEKISLYVADRKSIEIADVNTVVSRNKIARAFALGDALGDRHLPRLLRTLDEEMWAMQYDKSKSEIGMLYGLISKVRAMLFMKEAIREGLLKLSDNYYSFKAQLEKLPPERFSADKKMSPLGMNAYVLFRAAQQSANYSSPELVRAMELLLECNMKLVSSKLDEILVLQHTLAQIVGSGAPARGGAKTAR